MKVDGLEIPTLLTKLIESGVWPSHPNAIIEQNGRSWIPEDRARRLRRICLYPPPFRTLASDGPNGFYATHGALHELVREAAVPIADLGLGADSPILLYYHRGPSRPSVIHLEWPDGAENTGVQTAEDFESFAETLGLRPPTASRPSLLTGRALRLSSETTPGRSGSVGRIDRGDRSMMEALIGRLDRWLAANRPDYRRGLQPGVADAQLNAFEARFALELPAAFRSLYRWRNGQSPDNHQSLYLNRMFSPLEDVAETKELLDDMIGSDFDRPDWWRRGWVPFLSNGAGSHLCVEAAAEDGGSIGRIVAFWKADADRPIEHPNVEAWLADLVESLESGESRVL